MAASAIVPSDKPQLDVLRGPFDFVLFLAAELFSARFLLCCELWELPDIALAAWPLGAAWLGPRPGGPSHLQFRGARRDQGTAGGLGLVAMPC